MACATWVDDDDAWPGDEDVAAPDPSLVFGYGGTPEEPPVTDVRDVEPDPDGSPDIDGGGHGASAAFAGRRVGPVCTLPMVTATVRPRLSAQDIRATVRRHENDIRACYNRALRSDRTLQGRVIMRFVITGEGTVGAAEVASAQIDDPPLHGCLVETVKRWTFPAPPGSGVSVVNYPYVFAAT